MRRSALATCLIVAAASSAWGQQPLPVPPSTIEFLPRYDFLLSAARLENADQRFSWDTHWGGNFDLVDYVWGRAMFLADYQALLGSEFRPFDPYQGNYTLEASGSFRAKGTEAALVLNHVSRHLGDRPKRVAVAMNSLGGRVMRGFSAGSETIDLRVDLRRVIAQAYVDYSWVGDADLTWRHAMRGRVGLYGRAHGDLYGVDKSIAGRDRQAGGRVELGFRIKGSGGALELFGGWERMVDADPLDRLPQQWGFAGFRVVGR